jgi:hypothetical protein
MDVISMRKHLAIVAHLLFIKELLLERNPTNVRNVRQLFYSLYTLLVIREFILEKNLMVVRNLAIPSARMIPCATSANTHWAEIL